MAVGYQSFYQAQLTNNISDTDTVIPLDVAPTPSEGFLVIESTVTAKREIIYYTSKTSNSVTVPSGAGNGRGYDGTTATSHLQGAAVIMAPVGAMFDELRQQFTTTPQGWTSMVQNISTVTANGNRSYDLGFDATVASTLSPGMRLELTKTVAGNGYMGGAFNGSSHYFTKTSPTGTLGTVTNNFTIEAVVQPTSYTDAEICARSDGTYANLFELRITTTGQVLIQVSNGGAGNYRQFATYQSLPLNKKTHVAASWNGTGPTIVIYFDGIAVPTYQSAVAGTNPTTAGTGGDFSIGRRGAGATMYFPGYISNVAVFDAVLSAATIKQHATYKLTGSETNCIGAWSLDNTANDQSAAGNNLTATGGVGYTAMTPHGQLESGVQTTKAVGLVMNVATTTATVQVPEGVTIPTTGGITSVAYSTQANPYGWVSDKGRWEIVALNNTASAQASPVSGTFYNLGSLKLNVPVGSFNIVHSVSYGVERAASGVTRATVTTSTSTSTATIPRMGDSCGANVDTFSTGESRRATNITNTTATDYYVITKTTVASMTNIYNFGDSGGTVLSAIPSNL